MASEGIKPPVPYARLKDIANDACNEVLKSVFVYEHTSTETWNTNIINTILRALVNESTSSTDAGAGGQPQYKYVVNSTIIQHPSSGEGSEGGKSGARRGMHSASGAYWNNEKDGMWSFKYEAAEARGLDIVIGVMWVWAG